MADSKNPGQFRKKHGDEEGLGVLEEARGGTCPVCPWDVHLQPNQISGCLMQAYLPLAPMPLHGGSSHPFSRPGNSYVVFKKCY